MTRLAILWHMHQPYYEDLATGEHLLPWVRLHALKDYWGMAALAGEFEHLRLTFSLVPSLLLQLRAFADGRADDRLLTVGLRPARSLSASERTFLVTSGFHAPFSRMIRPHARYAELHARRHLPETFTTADVRDLQVWQKLAWMDPDRLETDTRMRALVRKQRRFSEEDKRVLREVELELLRAVIPAYREAAATRRIELATSPFYHPILPLVCNSDSHLRAHPRSALPRGLIRRPEDAAVQLRQAMAFHADTFGTPAAGVWPPEGALSDEVVHLLADVGLHWTASDEEVLARSLGRPVKAADLYRPWTLGTGRRTIRGLFRDHRLSDLIGFTYQSWDAEAAAGHFVEEVRAAGRRFRQEVPDGGGAPEPVVTVILDGENAWEHYAAGGRPFLRALYRRLEAASDIETVTMREAASGPAPHLPSVFPGSWINGDLFVWAGHPEDHRAWARLAAARAAYDAAAPEATDTGRARAWQALLIAEGSDWFWWYGDDHSSAHDREFDELFRRHLRNVYDALGLNPPAELFESAVSADVGGRLIRARTLRSPAVDGRTTAYAEWAGSTLVPLGGGRGTMHRAAGRLVHDLRVGMDRRCLYLQLGGRHLAGRLQQREIGLVLELERPVARPLSLAPDRAAGVRWQAAELVEIVVPFLVLRAQAGDRVALRVQVVDVGGRVLEQHPPGPAVEVEVPGRHVDSLAWVV